MIRSQLKQRIDHCFQKGREQGFWGEQAQDRYTLDVPKHKGQGDFATNLALVVGGCEKRNPREVAALLADMLQTDTVLIERVEIAGPGFVNFFLNKDIWSTVLDPIVRQGKQFGHSDQGRGQKVLLEFVSANPTGPLSIGHGRNGVLGDSMARLLTAVGYQVDREYYYNDAGRQMRVLGESLKARYRELLGLDYPFPEDGYQGAYLLDIARQLVDAHGEALKDEEIDFFKQQAEKAIFADIDRTLHRIGIHFDSYFNEHTLYTRGLIDEVVNLLRAKGLVYEKDGATWFRTTALGLEKDRVIIKSSGEPTYRLPDIAYHREKFRRGYDRMINVFGADHIATVPDVLAGVRALGYDDSRVEVVLHQFVTLMRDNMQVKMSTRRATFVTVDELVDEVGVDAVRFFFLMRKPDSQLEFDLELAKKEGQENPVYYVQYAHARLCSIQRQEAAVRLSTPEPDRDTLARLCTESELHLLKTMADYPRLVSEAARDLAPHRIIFFLMDLAGQFHSYYNKHKVLGDDEELSRARLFLCRALQVILANGLELVGVQAPERM